MHGEEINVEKAIKITLNKVRTVTRVFGSINSVQYEVLLSLTYSIFCVKKISFVPKLFIAAKLGGSFLLSSNRGGNDGSLVGAFFRCSNGKLPAMKSSQQWKAPSNGKIPPGLHLALFPGYHPAFPSLQWRKAQVTKSCAGAWNI